MPKLFYAVLTILIWLAPLVHAQGEGSLSYTKRIQGIKDPVMPSNFSISMIGQMGEPGQSSGGILFDLGRGSLGVQTGLLYMTLPMQPTVKDPDDAKRTHKFKLTNQYAAVPLMLKYNYIESPRQVFSVKAGVVWANLQNNGGEMSVVDETGKAFSSLSLTNQDIMASVGISGSASAYGPASLILDISYMRSITEAANDGSVNSAIFIGAGILFYL